MLCLRRERGRESISRGRYPSPLDGWHNLEHEKVDEPLHHNRAAARREARARRARHQDPRRRRISRACARPAGSPPRCSISSRRMSCRGSPPTRSTGYATGSSSITARFRRRSIIAASRARSAPRSTTSSATAFPATAGSMEGDIVNLDITVILDGWHGDTSRMYPRRREGAAEGAQAGRGHL